MNYNDFNNETDRVTNIPVLVEPVSETQKEETEKQNHPLFIDPPKQQEQRDTKTKRMKFKTVIAAVLAVVVIGGSAGYGGSYLANRQFVDADSRYTGTTLPIGDSTSAPEEDIPLSTTHLSPNTNTTAYTPTELYKVVKDTVVGIKLYYTDRFGMSEESSVVGSGVIFTTDGYLLTNYHVVTDNQKVGVMVSDYDDDSVQHEYMAQVVGTDSETDLAVLKIERSEGFKAAAIGNSDDLEVGNYVCAVGNPMGLDKSMTQGIVSGLNREADNTGYELSSIQTDAALNMGNSGGPLFDMYGSVVGIVNKKYVYDNLVDNIGFAITINEAKPIINDLLENGEVTTRPMLGINGIQVSEQTKSVFRDIPANANNGLWVSSINENAPALENGLRVGDIIIKINGADVYSIDDVQMQLKKFKAGESVDVVVMRYTDNSRGKEVQLRIQLMSSVDAS